MSSRFFLPSIQGRFPVGVTTFVTPVRPPRPIGSAKLKNIPPGRPNAPEHALFLEEVAFTAYYPADVAATARKGVPWFVRPIKESLRGFAAFLGLPGWLLWPVVYFFGAMLKIPAYPNAPLLDPHKAAPSKGDAESSQAQWPLVIFSHGLGGGRTVYSQFCSQLAASGRVVLAVEHRDGTGSIALPRSWQEDGRSEPRTILYLRETDVHWDDSDSIEKSPMPLRGQQLAFRHHEVYITYTTFCQLVNGDSVELASIDDSYFDRSSWARTSPAEAPKVRCDKDVVLAGHSFGGCTVLSLLSTKPLEGYTSIPVDRALVLDPWLEPLATPGPVPFVSQHNASGASKDAAAASVGKALEQSLPGEGENGETNDSFSHPRMLVINSERFTLWKDHFARLKECVAHWEPNGGRIMTLIGCEHVSFSDFPVLPVVGRRSARLILERIMKLSLGFLDDNLPQTLEELPTTQMEIEVIGVKKDGKPKRKLIGQIGDVIPQ